ncbi:unnamed protein product [Adineta ricciae]|uniref:Uncharacterized protein n=1 Tax=Adineta ricciae TaxID=249248 RepID=A0A814XC99_ADIRI|nr:unnamed protein product [Adineta ricciae]CAF1213028.1 unnamed protein product [Adineta ricciae]
MATALATQDEEQEHQPNLETNAILWLDPTIAYAPEFPQIQRQLRADINYLRVFKHTNECLEYLSSVPKQDQIILIVSGRLGQEIVPQVHNVQQISSIYVYCMDKKKNESWASKYPKIRRLVVSLVELGNIIHEEQLTRQQNRLIESLKIITIPALVLDREQSLADLYSGFIYSHLLIDCLRQTNSAMTDKTDLLSLCQRYYAGNEEELKILEEFNENYRPSRAIWWYTRQSFLYRLLNKALRDQNLELLLLFRFYFHDIERQLMKTKCSAPIRVFSGQLISVKKLEILKRTIGGFISTSSFLWASSKQQVQSYLSQLDYSEEFQRVLFEIEADPHLENIKPFSNLATQSYLPNEERTLFMPGTIFRYISIQIDEEQNWNIRLVLCSESNQQLRRMFNQGDNPHPLTTFGHFCCQSRRFADAERYYLHMLKGLPDDHQDTVLFYNALGTLCKDKGDYDSSLQWFNRALAIQVELLGTDHPDIADSYLSLAENYREKNDPKRAFDFIKKSIDIFQKNFGEEHPKIAACFNQIGNVHRKGENFPEALNAYETAHAIYQKHVPPMDPQLAESYKNLATVHKALNNIDQALDYYHMSLEIYTKTVTSSRFAMGMILRSIADTYEIKGQYEQAQLHYQRAGWSFQTVLPPTDGHLVQIRKDIQRVNDLLR